MVMKDTFQIPGLSSLDKYLKKVNLNDNINRKSPFKSQETFKCLRFENDFFLLHIAKATIDNPHTTF